MLTSHPANPVIHPRARCRSPRVATILAAAVVGVASLGTVGCAGKKSPSAEQQPRANDGPLVISGTPTADTMAFNSASRSLLTAQYGVLEDLGPEPKWRGFRNERDKTLSRAADAGDPEQGIAPAEEPTEIGASRSRKNKKNSDGDVAEGEAQADAQSESVADETSASVQAPPLAAPMAGDPAALEAMATQPLVGPLAPELLDAPARPRRLPVARMPLPDGRIRLIWHLRNLGGPKVTSKINGNSRRDISLTPADLAPIIALIQGHLSDKGQVLPLPNENKLIITCPEEMEGSVLSLLNELDVPVPQVEITAKIFEVSHDFDFQQGARLLLNRIAEDGTQTALTSFQTEALSESLEKMMPFQGSVVSMLQTFEEAGISLDASFELLAEAGLVRVVSSPRLTVAEGQTGYMLAGQELPIQSAEIINNTIKTSTQYKPVGVQLYITPQAVGHGSVKLHTVSIVSSVAGFSSLPAMRGTQQDALLINPIIESREAETAVTVPEGETLVISGMRMVRTTTREDKVPGLGDLPIIGNLFKNHRSQQKMTDLYFFVTPTLASAID